MACKDSSQQGAVEDRWLSLKEEKCPFTWRQRTDLSADIGNSTFSLVHILVCKMSKHTSIIVVAVLFNDFFFLDNSQFSEHLHQALFSFC